MARNRQPRFNLGDFPIAFDADREVISLSGEPGRLAFSILCYADEPLIHVGDLVMPAAFWFLWHPEHRPDLPLATLQLRVIDGVLEVESFALTQRSDGDAISAATLRAVRLPELIEMAGMRAGGRMVNGKWRAAVLGPGDEPDTAKWAAAIRRDKTQFQAKRGKRLTDETLEKVALHYRQARTAGIPPTKHVQESMQIAYSTAGRYVMEARRRGFLGPTTPGVPGETGGL